MHETRVYALAVCSTLNKFASCAQDGVRVVDVSDFKDYKIERINANELNGIPSKLRWTSDGQILTVCFLTDASNVACCLMCTVGWNKQRHIVQLFDEYSCPIQCARTHSGN
jgi:hypothetical protein